MNARPSWARRFRPVAERTCARPGCAAPAHATLRFTPTGRAARLVPVDPERGASRGDLCEHHAQTVVLPRGWQLHDERPVRPVPPLPAEHQGEPRARVEPRRLRAPRAVLEPDDHDPELDRLLDADSPLLRRAFRKSRGA